MKKKVVKLGGSILLDRDSLKMIVKFLKLYKNPVVVVSAFSGITNLLFELVNNLENSFCPNSNILTKIEDFHLSIIDNLFENIDLNRTLYILLMSRLKELREILDGICLIQELSPSSKNKIISFGERLSSLILKEYLISQGIPTEEKLPETLKLYGKTLSEFTSINFEKSKKSVKEQLSKDKCFVVPGFYCLSPCSKISVLGRGGSDYTATAIGSIINAESVDFWKDCNGFRTADPGIIEGSTQISSLSYKEAAEIAYFGAKIFHPSTVEPLKEKGIPLKLYNPENFSTLDKPLTTINKKENIHTHVIKSVTFSEDIGVVKLVSSDIGALPGIIANFADSLCKENINIKSIITSQTSINLLLDLNDMEKAFNIVSARCKGKINNISSNRNLALIAAVGQGVLEKPGIAHKLFAAVSKIGVNVQIISAGASDTAVYFIVNKEDRNQTIKAIHKEFFV